MAEDLRPDWAAVRRDTEAGSCTRAAVARKHAIAYSDLLVRASVNKWSTAKRSSSTDRLIIAERLLGLIELQIEHMEKRDMSETGEKEAAVLVKLTDTLGRLINIAKADASDPSAELETAEMTDIQRQLARRINEITKG